MRRKVEKTYRGARQFIGAAKRAVTGVELPRHIAKVAMQGLIPRTPDPRAHQPNKKMVVMAPGWGCGVDTMKPLGRALNGNANVRYPDNLPDGLFAAFSQMTLEEEASSIADFVDRADRVDGGQEDIYLVGHSNGGVASLLALRKMQEASSQAFRERLKGVVTMASPINEAPDYHYGHAPLLRYLPATKHLRPNSRMHRELKAHHESITLCIASSRDELLELHMQTVDGRPNIDVGFSHWDYTFGPTEKLKQVADHISMAIESDYS